MEKKSQNQIIADYLKTGNTLTAIEAQRLCGTMCLAQRIANLKRPPFNLDIDTKMIYAKGRNYAVYSLKAEKQSFWKRAYSNASVL